MRDEYVHGAWNVLCQRCGQKLKSHQLRKEHTGLRVCRDCIDPRHPQEFVRGRADRQAPPWVSPVPPDVYLAPTNVDPDGIWVSFRSKWSWDSEEVTLDSELHKLDGSGP